MSVLDGNIQHRSKDVDQLNQEELEAFINYALIRKNELNALQQQETINEEEMGEPIPSNKRTAEVLSSSDEEFQVPRKTRKQRQYVRETITATNNSFKVLTSRESEEINDTEKAEEKTTIEKEKKYHSH